MRQPEVLPINLSHTPTNAYAYYNLGVVIHEKRQLDEAITYYKKAIQIDPNLTDAYYNLGIALQEEEQFEEAITYYQKALRL